MAAKKTTPTTSATTAKKKSTTTAKKSTTVKKKSTTTVTPLAKTMPANPKAATQALAKLLAQCPEASEVKVPEETGIAVRLKTRQLELPLLVHVAELVVFDLYPFRFVGVDVARVDWPRLLRVCRTGYVQLGLDDDFDDDDVLVYSFPMALSALDAATVQTVIATLTSFAEEHYDEALAATGLVEKKRNAADA